MATKAKRAVPEGYHTVTAGLTIAGAAKAIDWYKQVFGAEELMRMTNEQGLIEHAELKIGDSRLTLADPMMGAKDARALGGSAVRIVVYTEDCDAIFNRATASGATAPFPLMDMFWGDRWGNFTDPFGHEWAVATHKQELTPEEIQKGRDEFMKEWAKRMKQQS
jgi:PhnB protein